MRICTMVHAWPRRGRTGLLLAVFLGSLMFSPFRAAGQNASPSAPVSDTSNAVDPTVQKYLIKGTTEEKLGDYEEAILYYETALDRTANNPVVLSALADAHHAKGDDATALFYARKAHKHGAERAYYQHRLAELQRDAGQPDSAIKTYQTLLDQFPTDTTAYRALADLQASRNRPKAALRTYDQMLEHVAFPPASVYQRMLSLHRRLGNPEGIARTLRALLDQRPNNRSYRRRLGEHYATAGDPEAALDLLAPLAKQQPNNASLQKQVRALSQQTGQTGRTADARPTPTDSTLRRSLSVSELVQRAETMYNEATSPEAEVDSSALHEAERLLERALDQTPTHEDGLTLRARLLEQKKQHENAAQAWERALEENPRVPERWTRAASAHLSAHNYTSAVSVAEEGLLLFPGHAPLARTAGFAQLRSAAPEQALKHFQQALPLRDDSAAAPGSTATLKSGLGLAYTQLDRPDDADEAFKQALSAAPEDPRVLRRYAYSLAHRKTDLDRALTLARRAVDRAPSDPLAHDTLGWVYLQRDAPETARRHLEHALEIQSSSARILEHAGDVEQALGNDTAARTYWQKALTLSPNRFSLSDKLNGASTP